MSTTHEMPEVGGGVPTVDLTSHIIAPDAIAALAPSDFVLVRFETRIVRGADSGADREFKQRFPYHR